MDLQRNTVGKALSAVCLLAFATGSAPAVLAAGTPQAASAGSNLGRPFANTTATRTAEVTADFASIFAGQIDAAINSGWAACGAPIVWQADLHELTAPEAAREVANLEWAFAQWSQASGLAFTYGGQVPLAFRAADFTLTPTDGSAPAARQIYLDFMGSKETAMLAGSTVGLGSPSSVMMSTKEIQAGTAVFRTEHIEATGAKDPKAVRSLYLHEIGHVLGLAHAAMTANVMYPVVTNRTALGAGDVRGVQVMTKPCPTPAPVAPEPAAPTAEPTAPAPSDPAPTAPADPAPAPTDPAPTASADPSASTPPASPTPPAPGA